MIGEAVGNYRITSKLGEGGMGAVYMAEHHSLGKKAVVKVLLPELSHNKDLVARFFNEARAATQIKHPGIVEVFDFGQLADGAAYIAMEFLEGVSLAGFLKQTRFVPTGQLIALARQMASALAAAHEKGIVHRDLKPDNIYLLPDSDMAGGYRVKVLDFGIAKLHDAGGGVKTRTGSVMGTPMYMSPEQCRSSGDVDARSDIYAVGCVLFEMACGRPPFVSDAFGVLIAAHLMDTPPTPRSLVPSLPPALEQVILHALQKRAEDRPQSMHQLKAELDQAVGGRVTGEQPAVGADVGQWATMEAQAPVLPGSRSSPGLGPASNPALGPTSYPGLGAKGPSSSPGLAATGYAGPVGPSSSPGLAAAGYSGPTMGPASSPGFAAGGYGGPGALGPGSSPGFGPPSSPALGPPSTLSRAAGEVTQGPMAPRSRAPIFAAIGAGVLVLGAGGAFMLRPRVAPTVAPAAVVSPAPAPPAAPIAAPAPVAPPPVAAPKAEPVVKKVHLKIESDPAGASIYREGEKGSLGSTPKELELDARDGKLELTLKLDGYSSEKLAIALDHDGAAKAKLRARSSSGGGHAFKPVGDEPVKPASKKIGDGTYNPFGQ